MDYYLLPPLLGWDDIPDPVTAPDNILDSDFPTDPTPVLKPSKGEGYGESLLDLDSESVSKSSLDLDSESVTIFGDKNGDKNHTISTKSKLVKPDEEIKSDSVSQKKVQVKPPRTRFRNVILSQFTSDPRTDCPHLSCVWEPTSRKTDISNHKASEHVVQDRDFEKTVVTQKDSANSPVVPHQVLSTPETSRASNTIGTSNTSLVPHQVLSQREDSIDSNAIIGTVEANLTSVVPSYVLSHHTTFIDITSTIFTPTTLSASVDLPVSLWTVSTNDSITTLPTDDFCRQWSLPDQRRIWEIAWYVTLCVVI